SGTAHLSAYVKQILDGNRDARIRRRLGIRRPKLVHCVSRKTGGIGANMRKCNGALSVRSLNLLETFFDQGSACRTPGCQILRELLKVSEVRGHIFTNVWSVAPKVHASIRLHTRTVALIHLRIQTEAA